MTPADDGPVRNSRGNYPVDGRAWRRAQLIEGFVLGNAITAPLLMVWYAVFGPCWMILFLGPVWVFSLLILRQFRRLR